MRIMLLALLGAAWAGAATAGDLPDLAKTPGAVRPGLTKAVICATKWGRDARHVSASMKAHVFAAYGLTGHQDPKCVPASARRRCEIDHLISRELGGDDVETSLWPQSYGAQPWNAVHKDTLENRLNREMCAGRITLDQARDMLVHDWRKAYVTYYGQP